METGEMVARVRRRDLIKNKVGLGKKSTLSQMKRRGTVGGSETGKLAKMTPG